MKTKQTISVDIDSNNILHLCKTVWKATRLMTNIEITISPSGHGFHVVGKNNSRFKPLEVRAFLDDDSVSGNTPLFWKENGLLQYTPIKKLHESFGKNNKIEVLGLQNNKPTSISKEIIPLKQAKVKWYPVKQSWKKKKRTLHHLSIGGNKIKVTSDHSLLADKHDNGLVRPQTTHDIIKDEAYVPIIKKPIKAYNKKNLEEFIHTLFLEQAVHSISKKKRAKFFLKTLIEQEETTTRNIYKLYRQKTGFSNKKRISKTTILNLSKKNLLNYQHGNIKLNQETVLAWKKQIKKDLPDIFLLLGLWLADGCTDRRFIKISTGGNPHIIKEVERIARNVLGVQPYHSKHRIGDLTFSNSVLVNIMKKTGFTGKSRTKKIPRFVFTLPNPLIKSLLRGYFSGDGCLAISKGYQVVSATSTSKELIEGIRILLLKLGIHSRIHKAHSNTGFGGEWDGYTLSIYPDTPLFLKKIGFIKKYNHKTFFVRTHTKTKNHLQFKAKELQQTKSEIVYDLEIEETNEKFQTRTFIANGILCHNSVRLRYSLKRNALGGKEDVIFDWKEGGGYSKDITHLFNLKKIHKMNLNEVIEMSKKLQPLIEKAGLKDQFACWWELPEKQLELAKQVFQDIRQVDKSFNWTIYGNFMTNKRTKFIAAVYASNEDQAHKRGTWLKYKIPKKYDETIIPYNYNVVKVEKPPR